MIGEVYGGATVFLNTFSQNVQKLKIMQPKEIIDEYACSHYIYFSHFYAVFNLEN